MKTPQQVLGEYIAGAIFVLILIGIAYWFGDKVVDLLQAPAREESLRGNNAAFKAGAEKNNDAIQKRAEVGKKAKEQSRAAVAKAGKAEEKRAAEILATPCTWGKEDYECARGRFIRELGLR